MKNTLKSALGVLLALCLLCSFALPAFAAETGITCINMNVGSTTSSRNFTWYSTESGTGTLKVIEADKLEQGEMPEKGASEFTAEGESSLTKSGYYSYQTTATGLAYETEYAYQITVGNQESPVYTFSTGKEGAFSFAAVGDPQLGAGSLDTDTIGWEKTLNIVNNNELFEGSEFLFSMGDQVNTAADEEQYACLLNNEYIPTMTFATNIGNHDTSSSTYSQHFNNPNASSFHGISVAGTDYYFVYNNVLFISLNSNNISTASHRAFMEQAIQETADMDIQWKVVTFHHSIFSVANHADDADIVIRRTMLTPVFEDLGIDVVLMGHDHVYTRSYIMDGTTPLTDASLYDNDEYTSVTDPDGILYVTLNSGSGSKYYSIKTDINLDYAATMNQDNIPNVSRIDVSDSQFTITTYETNTMTVVDTFTIHKTATKEALESVIPEDGLGFQINFGNVFFAAWV